MARKVSDEAIIKALLENDTQVDAAKSLKITPQTIINRMKKPDFVRKYHDTQNELLRSTTRKIANASNDSINLLINTMNDEDVNIYCRTSIAREILRLSRDFIKIDELQRRLTQIEYEMADRNDSKESQNTFQSFHDLN